MAVGICLPPKVVEGFKRALVSGKINPDKLAGMTSEARHKALADIVGEGNAKFINANFESKLLLKNQKLGFVRWAEKTAGLAPQAKRDLISRIGRLDKVLDPSEEKAFLHDLASTKLGVDVSVKEAKKISIMSTRLQEFEAKQRPDGTFPSEADRMAYGYAKVDMGAYLSDLKNAAEKPGAKDILMHPVETSGRAAGFVKALKASLDDSAVFRQGWKTIWTNPGIWQKNARKSIADLVKVGVRDKDVVREVMADVVSRPNYQKYHDMGLALGNVEEQFPTTLPGKVPVLGRAYKASEQAYEAFLYRSRADIADKLLQVAEKSDVNIADKTQLHSMGKLINALTGRGDIGHGRAASPIVNNMFFSIRFIKSNFDTLTAHQFQKGVTPFVRKQAAQNLAKVALGSAAVLAIADHMLPGSVEKDPTSKDFGKIKVGHTRFDVTGGMGSMATLAMQIVKNQEKSTSTGVVTKFGSGFGAKTGVDAINNYFENKLSPAASVVKDLIKRQDFQGNKPTVKGELSNLLIPLPIQTATQKGDDKQKANQLLISIADGMGIATNTYGGSSKKFDNSLPNSDKLQEFKNKVGDTKYREAEKRYNALVDQWMADHQKDLNSRPNDERTKDLNSVKSKILNNIYKGYGFKYKVPKPEGARKSLLDSAKNYK